MPDRTELIKAIAVTAELTGTELSQAAKQAMVEDLAAYPIQQVIGSLNRCRKELKGKLTIAEIVNRLDDGRPGAEQAWAQIPKDESETVCWTDEMAKAFGVALPLINAGEMVQARMAFLETYRNEVAKSREQQRPTKWQMSLGHDPKGREDAIREAVESGKIGVDRAKAMLPHIEEVIEPPKLTDEQQQNIRQIENMINGNEYADA